MECEQVLQLEGNPVYDQAYEDSKFKSIFVPREGTLSFQSPKSLLSQYSESADRSGLSSNVVVEADSSLMDISMEDTSGILGEMIPLKRQNLQGAAT